MPKSWKFFDRNASELNGKRLNLTSVNHREDIGMPSKVKLFAMLMAVAFTASFAFTGHTVAATKKLSYEQAYAKCKAILDKEGSPGTTTQSNVRHTRGAACMKKYGHNL